MEFRALTQADLEYVQEHSTCPDNHKKPIQETGWSVALVHEDKTLVIGGVELLSPTCGWAWFEMSRDAIEHIVTVYRTIKDWLAICCKEQGIRRLMCAVEVGFEEAERTVEHLGYHVESRMPKYKDDRPADLWVKFFGDSE